MTDDNKIQVSVCGDTVCNVSFISDFFVDAYRHHDEKLEYIGEEAVWAETINNILGCIDNIESMLLNENSKQKEQKIYHFWKKDSKGMLHSDMRIETVNTEENKKLDSEPEEELNSDEKRFLSESKVIAIYDVLNSNISAYDQTMNNKEAWKVVRTKYGKTRQTSDFLKKLSQKNAEKTVIILKANELRKAGFYIGTAQSWEQMAFDTYKVISNRDELKKFKYVIVCFEQEGALVADLQNSKYRLSYFPDEIEFTYSKVNGEIFGKLIAFQACIVNALCKFLSNHPNENNFDLESLNCGVRAGLLSMRKLINEGFCGNGEGKGKYPHMRVAKDINFNLADDEIKKVQSVSVNKKFMKDESNRLSLLLELITHDEEYKRLYPRLNNKDNLSNILKLSMEIVKEGKSKVLDRIKKVPSFEYGNLISLDRFEMGYYRDLYGLIENYMNKKTERPLSICVFGSPGSGKSFSVKEIIEKIDKKNTEIISCNLSQLFNPCELSGCFEKIRDAGLQNKVPVVFWDEFDTKLHDIPFGWLRWFLAPMQDGKYYDNGIEHHVGRAIFIFAGGINETMKEFEKKSSDHKTEKVPDFISRVKGSLNIVGPNAHNEFDKKYYFYLIRRAFILRHLFEKHYDLGMNGPLDVVGDEIISALLKVNEYTYGIRSMETVVEMIVANKEILSSNDNEMKKKFEKHLTDVNEFFRAFDSGY